MLDALHAFGAQTLGAAWPTIWLLARILALSVALLLCVAYLILWERKLIAWMHVRHGPNRVGPRGLLQPIADVLKLLTKEVVTPARAARGLYIVAPVMAVAPALAAWGGWWVFRTPGSVGGCGGRCLRVVGAFFWLGSGCWVGRGVETKKKKI